VRPVKQLLTADEAWLPAAQGGRGADEQQTGGLANEARLPVGRANRGAMDGLLRLEVTSRMLVMWLGIDRRYRFYGSMYAPQSVDSGDQSETRRCTEVRVGSAARGDLAPVPR
jgi:hypothetical protein